MSENQTELLKSGEEALYPIALQKLAQNIVGDTTRDNWEKLLTDPALKQINHIQSAWIVPTLKKYNPYFDVGYASGQRMLARWQAMVARNLFFQRKPVNKETVRSELNRMVEMRKLLQNEPLFYQKNILFVAHGEQDQNKQNIFGKEAVTGALKKLAAEYNEIRPNEEAHMEQTKQDVFDALENTPPPMVFIFSGHGTGDRFYLVGDEHKRQKNASTLSITPQELAQIYKKRLERYPQLRNTVLQEQDRYFFNTCFGHDFIRNFYTALGNSPMPLAYTSAEYGQEAYSTVGDQYENDFFKNILPKGRKKGTTFLDIFLSESQADVSNACLYVPDNTLGAHPFHISEVAPEQDEALPG